MASTHRGRRSADGSANLVFDGLANGWPPYWEQFPGPHQVAGAERSVGPEEIAAARWALALLRPGNRFAADYGNSPLLGTYGDQNPVGNVGSLYTSPIYTPSDAAEADAQDIRYVLIDQRLSQSLPASGQYFPIDPDAYRYTHPLPLADLTKFDHTPGVARIYDSGNIVIYDLDAGGMRSKYAEIGVTATVAALSFGATVGNAPVPVTAVLGIAIFASVGYVWVNVLFDHRVAGLERVAVATGLALSVPVLGGLVLQGAGIPLHPAAWASCSPA